jgi:hypothetical protein
VSWLWDVSFAAIKTPVMCGGIRGWDMTNRLKYDNVHTLPTHTDLREFVDAYNAEMAAHGGEAILFCTYTAMLKIRSMYLGTHSGLGEDA